MLLLFHVLAWLLLAIVGVYSAPLAMDAARSQTYSADGTFYEPGLGACGKTNSKNQLIVAVGRGVFDSYPGATPSNPNKNPICGKRLRATYGQKSVTVAVEDRCAGCPGAADLDFTEAGFERLAALEVGRLEGVKWQWV